MRKHRCPPFSILHSSLCIRHFVLLCIRHRAFSIDGFTLAEILVASAIVIVISAAMLTLVVPAHDAALTEPVASDMQQRLRIAAAAITNDLLMAGAGSYLSVATPPLGRMTAAIVPRRIGLLKPDLESTVATDRLSLIYVPPTAAQTTIGDSLASAAGPILLNVEPGCPGGSLACGFSAGMTAAVFDESGAVDTFKVLDVQAGVLDVRHQGGALTKSYGAGAHATEIATVTYWLDAVSARLMKYDGDKSDLPVLDHIVSLRFDYFGDPRPPALIVSTVDPNRRMTTYGPLPPPPSTDDPTDAWPSGENCVFQIDEATHAHIARLPDLGSGGGALVPIATSLMQDGPWCPDGFAPNRYDADLLRIRMVRVMLRVEAASAALRGPAGLLFMHGGTAGSASRIVPDREIRFDVAPRNLNLQR